MKKTIKLLALGSLLLTVSPGCDELSSVVGTADDILNGEGDGGGVAALSNEDVIKGLKEALTIGTNNSSASASKTDGFWKNPSLKIPFPPDAQKVKDKVLQYGFEGQIEKFEMTLNRAAEEASKEAAPIFVNAITSMSIGDGFAILKGDSNAATMYLREKTTAQLVEKFTPKVSAAIDKVELTKYWEPIINKYNLVTSLTGGNVVEPDLNKYVTDRAMDGLFLLLAKEEGKIRDNPAARVTDLLQKVFGSLTGGGTE